MGGISWLICLEGLDQLLANIKANTIKDMTIIDKEFVITQLADDTTLFRWNDEQIPITIKVTELSKASNVYLNV